VARTWSRWLCAAVFAAGCGSSGGGRGERADAGGSPDPDARAADSDGAVAAVDGGFRPAACQQDANDAPTCPAPALEERVAVETYPGIAVLFHDPDGCLVCRTVADEAGLAEAALPGGGMASITDGEVAFTVGGLSAGDSIHIGYPAMPGNTNPRTFRVSAPDQVGATSYRAVVGGCAGSAATPPIDLVVDDSCLDGDGSVSIIMVASDAGGTILAYGWIADAAVPPAGEIASVSLSAWATGSSPVTFAVSAIPDDIGEVSATFGWAGDRYLYDCCSASSQSAAAVDLDLAIPSLPGAPDLYSITLDRAMGHDTDMDLLMRVVDDVTSPIAIDVASDFLPHITSAAHDREVDRPVFSWVTAAEPGEADLLVLRASWQQYQWWFALPPDTAPPVAFPDMPDDLGPSGLLGRYAFVMYADVSTVTTWSQARADAYALFFVPYVPRWSVGPGFVYRLAVYDDYDFPEP